LGSPVVSSADEVTQEQFRPRGPQPTAADKDAALFAELDRVIEEQKLGARDDISLPNHIVERLEQQRKARLRIRGWRA
jgi:hypothetical protein